MGNFGLVVLILFIIIRIMIAGGLVYLIIYEARRYKRRSTERSEGISRDANGKEVRKHSDSSSGSRE